MGISTPTERKAFVKRLKQACDNNPNIPPERMGRQAAIASSLGVVPEAVSRWFAGETMPNNDRVRELAKLIGVDVAWLVLGHGDPSPTLRAATSNKLSASAMLVRALLNLHGITAADVPPNDPNATTVSFYAVIDSRLVPIIVVSGTLTAEKGEFEAIVPANYEVGEVICVIPRGLSPVLLLLSSQAIKRSKRATSNGIALTIAEAGSGLYRMGQKQVPRIRSFSILTGTPSEVAL